MFRFILLMGACLFYIIHELFDSSIMESIYLLICTGVFLSFFPYLRRREKVIAGSLFSLGIILKVYQGSSGFEILTGINQNMAILSIIILAPLISIPLKQEGLLESVVSRLKDQRSERSTFYNVGALTIILAPILNMGAVRIVDGFVSRLQLPPKTLSHSYYNAVAPAFIWSPFYASVGTVLFMTDMSYISYMLIGIGFAIMQVIAGSFILRPKMNEVYLESLQKQEVSPRERKKLLTLLAFIFLLLVTLILEEAFTDFRMLFLVSINCIFIPLLWAILRRRWKDLREEFIKFQERTTNKSNTEVGLFLSAGLFGNAIIHTPIIGIVENVLIWSSNSSILLLFIILILFMLFMAMMGIHQIIVVPVIITILLSPNLELNMMLVAFMCIFAWMLSAAISPVNPLNVIISQCVGRDGFTIALKWNGKYFLAVTGIAFTYVYLLNYLG